MSSVNAIGVIIGNPDEIIFCLTKGDVERVYNMTHHLPLGTSLPDLGSPSQAPRFPILKTKSQNGKNQH
jgi:hypothetical protein